MGRKSNLVSIEPVKTCHYDPDGSGEVILSGKMGIA